MTTLQEIHRQYPISLSIAWTVLLLSLCLAPERIVPNENALPIKRYIPFFDLMVHFSLFAGFVLSWMQVAKGFFPRLAVVFVGVFLALATEIAQGIPMIHRDPSKLDLLADIVGIILGVVIFWVSGRKDSLSPVPQRSHGG